jgi:hypothetical protein
MRAFNHNDELVQRNYHEATAPGKKPPEVTRVTRNAAAVARRGHDIYRGTHGTTMANPDQKYVMPGNVVGKKHYPISNTDRAYYVAPKTNKAGAAEASRSGWQWAHGAVQSAVLSPVVGNEPFVPPRPVVHHVAAEGKVDVDYNMNNDTKRDQMTADRLRITDTEWIRTPDALFEHGVQGTLPHMNWNQFVKRNENESWTASAGRDSNNTAILKPRHKSAAAIADDIKREEQQRRDAQTPELPGQQSLL